MAGRSTSGCRSSRTHGDAVRHRVAPLLALGLLLAGTGAQAQDLSVSLRSRALQPGEAVVVTATTGRLTGQVTVTAFGATWPAYKASATTWRALVGIDLDRVPGTYTLTVTSAGPDAARVERRVTVVAKQFRRRILRVAPDYVNPPPELLARIKEDADFLRTVYAHSAGVPTWADGFARPVPDPANSSFGTRSVFNGEPRSPHGGTDFLSPEGRPIHAPAGGTVVAARDLFFTGNTVVIDHGLGVFSMLAHLSRLDVAEGQAVAKGDVVGLVGATGRVTGPHLHWALRVGDARVDPLSTLALLGGSTAPRTAPEAAPPPHK